MKLLICGSRYWDNYEYIDYAIDRLKPSCIIQGGAQGADRIAKIIAEKKNIQVIECPADWDKYGKRAGHIRNGEMLKEKPDLVIAFIKSGLPNKGTNNMIKQAEDANYRVIILSDGV